MLDGVFGSVQNGQYKTLLEAVDGMDMEFGMTYPLGYGLSVTLQSPLNALNNCSDRREYKMLDKMVEYGGAISVVLDFIGISAISAFIWYKPGDGTLIVIKEEVNIGDMNASIEANINKMDGWIVVISHSPLKFIGVLGEVHIIHHSNLSDWFNKLYFSGYMSN